MFKHVTNAKYIEDYRIWLSFNDGKEGEINLAVKLKNCNGVFNLLKNIEYFRDFKIVNDTLSWKNGADFAPESLYKLLKEKIN